MQSDTSDLHGSGIASNSSDDSVETVIETTAYRAQRRPHDRHQYRQHRKSRLRCVWCYQDHTSFNCPELMRLSPAERLVNVSNHDRCPNCLGIHRLEMCNSTRRCLFCNGKHHSILHHSFVTDQPPTTRSPQRCHPRSRLAQQECQRQHSSANNHKPPEMRIRVPSPTKLWHDLQRPPLPETLPERITPHQARRHVLEVPSPPPAPQCEERKAIRVQRLYRRNRSAQHNQPDLIVLPDAVYKVLPIDRSDHDRRTEL